jgi:signal transduction histidine kinase
VHGAPLPDRRGQVIVFNEITELKRAQALLFQHQRSLATLEERDRIARELHDSLGQVLGYVNVQAQAIRELLAHGETATADAHLAQLANVAKDAHTDVREYILCVRTAVSPERGFVSALQQYLQRFSQNYGIRTELNGPEALKARGLQPTTEVQLLRIVQEALSNVRKHSSARAVRVNLTVDADQAEVVIEDDGRGFDPVQLAVGDRQHFGVGIMRERAEEIGGTLEVQSAPEQGTRVIVRVPLK